ncbi:putative reverse transcriptase domain-containing protein [Helianthus debilis subsp. tardiflorus]
MKGRSTTEAIYILRRLMEKYRAKKQDLHMVFIDLEKAYDTVPRRLIWDSLEGRGLPGKYIDIIKDTYDRMETTVRAPVEDTNFFPVEGIDLVISVFEDSRPSLDSLGTTTEFHKSSKDLSNWKILGASLHEAVRYMMVRIQLPPV